MSKTMAEKVADAKNAQAKAMDEAPDLLARYWAGSVGASVLAHYKAGAVRTVRAAARRNRAALRLAVGR